MKTITIVMTMIASTVGLLANPDPLPPRDYDTKTVQTIGGNVLSVEKITPPKRRGYLVLLMLQTGNETIPVHVGPAWYVDHQTPRIEANDMITVTGSRVMVDGRSAIVAAAINKGNEVLRLRDANGMPFWPSKH